MAFIKLNEIVITLMKYIMQIILACNGSFGMDCQYQCHINCINQMCDRFNGSCLHGCKEGVRCVEGKCLRFRYFSEICFLQKVYIVKGTLKFRL